MTKLRSRPQLGNPSQGPQKRPGEQFYMHVDAVTQVSTSGETSAVVGIPLGLAPVPERKYVADMCHVTSNETGVKIIFGQVKLAQDGMRSAVVVKMSRRGIGFLLNAVDEIKNPSYADIILGEGLKPITLPPLSSEPDQVVMLAANMAITAMSGEEVALDFLQISPFSMAAIMKGAREVAVDPVVRVDLNSELFMGLIDTLRKIPGLNKEMDLQSTLTDAGVVK